MPHSELMEKLEHVENVNQELVRAPEQSRYQSEPLTSTKFL